MPNLLINSGEIDFNQITTFWDFFFTLILPLIIGFFLTWPLGFIDTYIHEMGHFICLYNFAKRNPNFKYTLTHKIKLKGYIKNKGGFLFSNYYQFLQDTKPKYLKEIKAIAISGVLFSTILYSFLLTISIILTFHFKNSYFLISVGFFLVFILREIIPYHISKNKFSDKAIYKNPELFEYHPELH